MKKKITLTKMDGNWVAGRYAGHTFEAKFFKETSVFGMQVAHNDGDHGRTSKLMVWNADGDIVFNYDRGMDVDAEIGHQIANALEQLPDTPVCQTYTVEA